MFTVKPIKKYGLSYFGVFYNGAMIETHLSQALAITKALQLQARMKQVDNAAG